MTIEEFKFMYRRPLEEMAIGWRPLNAPGQTGPVTEYEIDQIVMLLQAHAATDAMYREEARQRRLEQVEWKREQERLVKEKAEDAKREEQKRKAEEEKERNRKLCVLQIRHYGNSRQSRTAKQRQIKALGLPI